MNELYYEFAKNVKTRLLDEINGRIVYEVYPYIDTIIFKINFKDFEFTHAINGIQDRVYTSDNASEDVVEDLLHMYKMVILNAFFKTEERKRRDEDKKLGIVKGELV